jgi:hypothetical protein
MSAARSTSPQASPTLDLDTQGENLPRTFIGRLLLSGRPADEPEEAFRAQVEAQGAAYATGVLALMLSGAVGVTLSMWRESNLREPQMILAALYFRAITLIFAYTLGANIVERPNGVIIASIFIVLLLIASAISRYARSTEMRVSKVTFVDQQSAELWGEIAGGKVNVIPHSIPTAAYRASIADKLQRHFKIDGPLAFIHVNLVDDRSEFLARLRVQAQRETNHYVIEVSGGGSNRQFHRLSERVARPGEYRTGADASQSDETVFSLSDLG